MAGLRDLFYKYIGHDHSGYPQGVLIPRRVQPGMIIAWASTSIPSGWARCDGANGTPNLLGRFVRGASGDGGAYPIGGSGGADSHAINHSHGVGTLGTDATGGHQHSPGLAAATGDTHAINDGDLTSQLADSSPAHAHSVTSNLQGGSAHTVSGTTGTASASTSVDNKPVFVNSYWIMKL